jgi:hypothetical protein
MATVISLAQVVAGIEGPISLSMITSIPVLSGFSLGRGHTGLYGDDAAMTKNF